MSKQGLSSGIVAYAGGNALASVVGRLALLSLVLSTWSCSIPGVRKEGVELEIRNGALPAAPAAVLTRAHEWLSRREYVVVSVEPEREVRAERSLSSELPPLVGVLELRVSGTSGNTETRFELRGYSVEGSGIRRRTSQIAPAVVQDLRALDAYLSCAAARWPGCP